MRSSRGLRACRVTTSTPTTISSSRSWTNATWSRREAPGSKSTSKSRSLSGRDSPWRLNQTRQSDEPRASAPRERFPRGGGAIPLWSARHPSHPKDTAACLGGASDRDTTSRRTPCLLALRVAGAVRVAPLKACQVRAERGVAPNRRGAGHAAHLHARWFQRASLQGLKPSYRPVRRRAAPHAFAGLNTSARPRPGDRGRVPADVVQVLALATRPVPRRTGGS